MCEWILIVKYGFSQFIEVFLHFLRVFLLFSSEYLWNSIAWAAVMDTQSSTLIWGGRGLEIYCGNGLWRRECYSNEPEKNHIHINCKYYLFVVSVFDEWWELLMFLFATFSVVSRSKENNISSWTLLLAGWLAVRQAGRQASLLAKINRPV